LPLRTELFVNGKIVRACDNRCGWTATVHKMIALERERSFPSLAIIEVASFALIVHAAIAITTAEPLPAPPAALSAAHKS
jgi:hypothetical protein